MNNKMKILLVVPRFPPALGGVENYSFQIALQLQAMPNTEVVVVTSNTKEKKEVIETYKGLKVYRLPIMTVVSNSPINLAWFGMLKRIIAIEKPDLINAQAPVPGMADIAAAVAGKTPFVLSYHAGTMKKGKLIPDLIIGVYEMIVLPLTARKATKIICSSNFVRTTILKAYQEKSIVVHPGVDIDRFKPDVTVSRIPNQVLFICRYKTMFYLVKGLQYLIDAVKQIPAASLTIIGQEDTDVHESQVHFVGVKHGKDLVKAMQQASVFVLPSLADKESFGMVLAEAMACKTPVIGTNAGGIPEVITEGVDGLLVPEKDSKALAEAIRTITENQSLAEMMGEHGYQKIHTDFTWESRAKLTFDLFISCIK